MPYAFPLFALLAFVAWLLLTAYMLYLLVDYGRAKLAARRRQRQLTADAIKYLRQRQLQQRIRLLVEDEQRRRLAAASQTGRLL